jgi:hypothetical protein
MYFTNYEALLWILESWCGGNIPEKRLLIDLMLAPKRNIIQTFSSGAPLRRFDSGDEGEIIRF